MRQAVVLPSTFLRRITQPGHFRLLVRLVILLSLLITAMLSNAQVTVTNLRCEMLLNPLGIDALQPRFSWQLQSNQRGVTQTYYQILVSSSQQKLKANDADVWNSGMVPSSQSVLVVFAGRPLQSATRYFWKVTAVTNKGMAVLNEQAFFSTGLFAGNDGQANGWKAKWIGDDRAAAWDSLTQWSRLSARYFRKEFDNTAVVKRATVYISGLGMYELYINGKKIGDQVLAPNTTDYRASFFYNTFDVTTQIKNGKNAVAAVLGNGRFFSMRQNYTPNKHNSYGFSKLLLQLEIEYADGTKKIIASDEGWKMNADGPIRTNKELDGEEYDAGKEFNGWTAAGFNDSKWLQPELVKAPNGKMLAQMSEPIKVMQTIKPISMNRLSSGKYILDMGQYFSGWLKLQNINGKKGDQITLKFAESLKINGELFIANLSDAKVADVYTFGNALLGDRGWQPSFVYHGFRYVEVSGFPGTPALKNFEGKLVYEAMETTGSFHSANPTLNAVYKNAWWGIASNYKGMPVVSPQRNLRQPYLGDQVSGEQGESYLFNNATLYAKWMDDILQSQSKAKAISDLAPALRNDSADDITWPTAFITISNNLYNQFGDVKPLQKNYASMKKWMNYLRDKYLVNDIMINDQYGDWCVPPENLELNHASDTNRLTDGQLIATAHYYKLLSYMERFAKLTGNEADVLEYKKLANKMSTAFQLKFYNAKKRYYSNNTVTANLLPLYFGICPDSLKEKVFANIYEKIKIETKSHVSTGLIGTQFLFRGLTEYGLSEMAYMLASNITYPSYGYMIANGATTIWETWNGNMADTGMNSQNHARLLGDLLIWYYENLAGISTDKTAVAFKKIIMKPTLPAGIGFVNASYKSAHGLIKSSWKNELDQFEWSITIPANTTAVIYIPAAGPDEITEGGKAIANNSNVKFVMMEKGAAVFEVASGTYSFVRIKKWKHGILKDEFIFERTSYPESHASTIAETPAGLIAAWFGGTEEGDKDVCIWTSHLVNGKWTASVKAADGIINDTLRHPCYNPVLYQVPGGELLLFFKIGPNVVGWKGYMIRSKDNGYSWGPRESLPEGFLGPIKNKPVMINGVLVCPSSTENNGWQVHMEYTTDFGKTWTKSPSINDGKIYSAIQPSILQYKNGQVQIVCRSKNTTINESWSSDEGKTWTAMKATALPNNNSGTDAVTLKDGRQLLVYNHAQPDSLWVNGKGPRTPLNVAVSTDGEKWFATNILEDSPIGEYSYPSVIQTKDGLVHIVYTWRRERVKHVVIDPSKIKLKEIIKRHWPGVVNIPVKVSDD